MELFLGYVLLLLAPRSHHQQQQQQQKGSLRCKNVSTNCAFRRCHWASLSPSPHLVIEHLDGDLRLVPEDPFVDRGIAASTYGQPRLLPKNLAYLRCTEVLHFWHLSLRLQYDVLPLVSEAQVREAESDGSALSLRSGGSGRDGADRFLLQAADQSSQGHGRLAFSSQQYQSTIGSSRTPQEASGGAW